jgi:high-affinity nickel permease
VLDVVAVVATDTGLRSGLLVAAFGFGLRHGIDFDHIAAITDLTGSAPDRRSSMRFATVYAAGHAAVVLAFGTLAVVAGDVLPARFDEVMGRVVGVTLLVLGVWMIAGLARRGRAFRMQSRWTLVLGFVLRLRERLRSPEPVVIEHEHEHAHGVEGAHDHGHGAQVAPARLEVEEHAAVMTAHRHRHVHRGTLPDDPFARYGSWTSLTVGMLHGVGAETPTQVVLFLAAARAGGTVAGELALVAFVVGLVVSNTAIAAAATAGFLNAARHFRIYAGVAIATAVFSLGIGTLFVLGRDSLLPSIFAG